MVLSTALDVAIGVIFVFLLVSILCSAIREAIEGVMKTRAAYLEHGIRELLHDKGAAGLAQSFFNHPLIYSLYPGGYTPGSSGKKSNLRGHDLPSYIPSKNFALAVMDIAARGGATDAVSSDTAALPVSLDVMRTNVSNLQNPAVQRVLLLAIDHAEGDLRKVQKSLEQWFDTSMDRVSGWYKRSTQWILFVIGLATAVVMNINTITIADYLARHPDQAAKVADVAAKTQAPPEHPTKPDAQKVVTTLDSLSLPIGWSNAQFRPGWEGVTPATFRIALIAIVGWLMTAFAATLGAPFWFDLLNKFMVIRSTVKPHEKSPEESSEDRQKPKTETTEVVVTQAAGTAAAPLASPHFPPPPLVDTSRGADIEEHLDGCDVLQGGVQ